MANPAQIKNINNAVRDMQKQISQLKSQQAVFNKKRRGEYVLRCLSDSVAFKQYDLCKVVGNTVYKFDGTEDYESNLLPGVVVVGNYEHQDGDVLVLVNGTTYVKVAEVVIAGQLLFPGGNGDYTQGKLTGNVGFWKVLEDAEADDLAKVTIIYGTGSESAVTNSYPCITTGGPTGGAYPVGVYKDGRTLPMTGTGTIQVLQLHISSVIPVGTWLMGFDTTLVNYSEVP